VPRVPDRLSVEDSGAVWSKTEGAVVRRMESEESGTACEDDDRFTRQEGWRSETRRRGDDEANIITWD